MEKRWVDFLSSFGVMLLGVTLLFFGTLTFHSAPVQNAVARLPLAGPRVVAPGGGDVEVKPLPVSRPHVPLPKDDNQFDKTLSAAVALVVDDKTNTILFKKNIDEIRPLASISKLMSALVLNDLPMHWSSTTIIIDDDVDTSSHHINVGEKFALEDLWHIALIGSSNSAIQTLVRASGFTDTEFAVLMNKKASDLNLTTLHFEEPTGLDVRNIGSALDTARLLKEALKVDKIYRTLQIGEYYAHPLAGDKLRRVWTTDWLLTNWVPNKFGQEEIVGKTGYISDSGYNFVVRLTDDSKHSVRVVVLGAATNEARFSEARDLAEWAFSHYVWPGEAEYDALAE